MRDIYERKPVLIAQRVLKQISSVINSTIGNRFCTAVCSFSVGGMSPYNDIWKTQEQNNNLTVLHRRSHFNA